MSMFNFCPVPHRQREFAWLGIGCVIGAGIVYYQNKKSQTRLNRRFPNVVNKVRVVTTEDRTIDEYVGNVATGNKTVSVAIVDVDSKGKGAATEGSQTPKFDEVVVVLKGRFQVKYNDGKECIEAIGGQTLLLPKGFKYEYNFPTGSCSYVPICMPAFSPDMVY